jgi:ribosomal protein S18 acetylase RimI-like enzyme
LHAADHPGLNPALNPALLARVEDAGLNASAPPQQRWLDGWLLRFSPGKAKRARCVNAVALGRRPTKEKLDQTASLFQSANLPLIFRITPFTLPAGLDAQLQDIGFRRFDDTRVMVLPDISSVPQPTPVSTFQIRSIALEPFAQRVGALRGSPLAQRLAHAQRLANAPVPFHAFELRSADELLACGQFALEGDLVGLYDVFTAPSARRKGLATHLCQHLLAQAQRLGALQAYLQVESDNHSARSVYHRLGFCDGYSYHYRTPDPSVA